MLTCRVFDPMVPPKRGQSIDMPAHTQAAGSGAERPQPAVLTHHYRARGRAPTVTKIGMGCGRIASSGTAVHLGAGRCQFSGGVVRQEPQEVLGEERESHPWSEAAKGRTSSECGSARFCTAAGALGGRSVLDARGRLLITQSSICAAPCRFKVSSPSRMACSCSGE